MPKKSEFVTTDDDWRSMEVWLVYGALLKTPNYGAHLHYEIPYGRDNTETHPRSAWVNKLSARYAGGMEKV